MLLRTLLLTVISATTSLAFYTQTLAQPQVHKCVVDGRTVFQEVACAKPRSPDPVTNVAKTTAMQKRPDAEALRAEQARRREEIQKDFRDTREIPMPDLSREASTSPKSSSEVMAFEDCIRTIQRTASQLAVAPQNIVETPDIRMVRFNTRDGSILVTCSRADQKMITTVSQK